MLPQKKIGNEGIIDLYRKTLAQVLCTDKYKNYDLFKHIRFGGQKTTNSFFYFWLQNGKNGPKKSSNLISKELSQTIFFSLSTYNYFALNPWSLGAQSVGGLHGSFQWWWFIAHALQVWLFPLTISYADPISYWQNCFGLQTHVSLLAFSHFCSSKTFLFKKELLEWPFWTNILWEFNASQVGSHYYHCLLPV